MSCHSRLPLNDYTRYTYTNSKSVNVINKSQIMNVGRFRKKGLCNESNVCINNIMPPWFKNSVKNQYLNNISYPSRLTNTIVGSQKLGTKTIVQNICINKQFGRPCGKGGMKPTNSFGN